MGDRTPVFHIPGECCNLDHQGNCPPSQCFSQTHEIVNNDNQVFPKIDHSARSDGIVLVEYTIGSVVELKFC